MCIRDRVYSEAMPVASRIYLTEVDASLDEADTFFPEIDRNQWTATSQSDTFTDEPTGLSYRFINLHRL